MRRICTAGIAAADAGRAVERCVDVAGHTVVVAGRRSGLPRQARCHVLALGKAAAPMAAALVRLLESPPAGGVVVTKHGHGRSVPGLDTYEGGHPAPDAASVRGARAVVRYARECVRPGDVVWVALSGGASAVCCLPATGVTLADKRRTSHLLQRAGASIGEINTVRKHLSDIKGGRLASLLAPARVWTLAVSDVPGNDPATIGSGPTVADPTTFHDACRVLDTYGLWSRVPTRVRARLEAGRRGTVPDTPEARAPVFQRARFHIVADNRLAVTAAAAAAREAGYPPLILSTSLGGDTQEAARLHAAIAREVCASGHPGAPPLALISGGETVVRLGPDPGTGGRAQEFTLAFLAALGPTPRPVAVACVGTDGTDGPTDAAGALGDDRTLARAAAAGLADARDVLQRHDAYPWFAALGDLMRTGPTGTNVMDLRVVLIG